MLADRELVHQDLTRVQRAALQEEREKAERTALNSCNQALVRNTHVCTRVVMHALNVNTWRIIQWGLALWQTVLRWDFKIRITN